MTALLVGCTASQQTPQQRAEAAKVLFDQATKNYHLPSAEATGADKVKLQQQAAAAYRQLLKKYPDQPYWAAQALCSLGNIRAAQTNLNDAVQLYAEVAKKYPQQEFEVLQAWKAAADLLWEANRRAEAHRFYQQIVQHFDGTNQPSIVQLVVKGSKARLNHVD